MILTVTSRKERSVNLVKLARYDGSVKLKLFGRFTLLARRKSLKVLGTVGLVNSRAFTQKCFTDPGKEILVPFSSLPLCV